MTDQPPRPSRAPLYVALGCVGLLLVGGCGVLGLLFLGLVAVGGDDPGDVPLAPINLSDADATLAWTLPAGWKQDGAWMVKEQVEDRGGGASTTAAQVRLAPAIAASGDMGSALRALWQSQVPSELANRASGMVYRRYLGDGLVASFVMGKGREKDRAADTLFTVYLIDCGSVWQPLIVAQTYADPSTSSGSIVAMQGDLSLSTSAAMAEELLATLRCPAGKGRPLVDAEALVGSYSYGSGASQMWENVYTGATTMTVASYGGELDLRADGTYTSQFSGASGQVGNLSLRSETQTGRWRVEGDVLVLVSDDPGTRDRQRRIAGVTQFSDGVKVAVLLTRMDLVVNAMSVGDPSDFYSTKR